MMEHQLVAAIDGGGTNTVFTIANTSGCILGVGRGGPINALFVSEHEAIASVRTAASSALSHMAPRSSTRKQSCGELPVAALYASAPGASPEIIAAGISGIVNPATIAIEGDENAVLAGAHTGGCGVVVLAGTGSFAFGKASDGYTASTGGWGPLLGDEGSGHAIGLSALRAAVCASDGRGPATVLTDMALEHFRIAELRGLIRLPMGRENVAAFAMCVSSAAAAGDEVACAILRRAGRDLGMLGARVAEELLPHHRGQLAVALTGGASAAGRPLAEEFEQIMAQYPRCRAVPPAHSPAIGALILALRMVGVDVDDTVITRIRQEVAY